MRCAMFFGVVGVLASSVHADSGNENMLTLKAQELVKERLKDPDSAKFKNLYPSTPPGGGVIICGEVNAKNKYGGYGGFRRFFSTGFSVRFKEDDPETFDGIYETVCRK